MEKEALRRNLISLGAVLGLAALMMHLLWSPLPPNEAEAGPDAAERATQTAMTRIAAESRGAPQLPPVQAGLRSGEAGEGAGKTLGERSDGPAAIPSAAPPEGYSFVAAPTRMPKAPLPQAQRSASEPPGADLHWLAAPDSIAALVRQAERAERGWSFGWLRLAAGARPENLQASLRRLGGEALGASGNLLRAKLPGDADRLQAIAALPEVLGLGAPPRASKLAAFAEEALTAPSPVFIALMTDDPDGRWRQALENAGATVGHFHEDIRAYPANVSPGALEAIAALDFVLAVEPLRVVRAALDRAVMAVGADALRERNDASGLLSGVGGASVPVGLMDSGLNIEHPDIARNRDSICGANLLAPSEDLRQDEADLWLDAGDHGTHVSGILFGNGVQDFRFAGMAPLVRHIRFVKVLHQETGAGDQAGIMRAMDFLAQTTSCPEAQAPQTPIKPLIVNMSLAADSAIFRGKTVMERKLDAIVWNHRQLYAVAQGNAGEEAFSDVGAAKNTLSVGAIHNDGELASFSGRGPTADGRLAPQVVASGVAVRSVKGDGSTDEYLAQSGTSMATPAVAGVVALLMDAAPAYKEQPALVRARLMASAVKPDAWLHAPARFPASNSDGPGALQRQFGLGKVSARTSVLNRDQADGWVSGSAVSEPRDGEYAWQDIEVPANASRLDLVLTWDEPPADALGSTVLNDLDLWLDRGGDCGVGACGEHSSASRKDNAEWIIVRDPPAGTYRVKVVANRVYGAAPRAALAWTVIRGSAAPALQIRADRDRLTGSGPHALSLRLTADSYVASGMRLHFSCRGADGTASCQGIEISEVTAKRADGVSVQDLNALRLENKTNLLTNPILVNEFGSTTIPLGEIAVGENREVRLSVSYSGADAVVLHFKADAWNAEGASASVELQVGGQSAQAVALPTNASFGSAASLRGAAGEAAGDLLRAATEIGEPLFRLPDNRLDNDIDRPAGSLWYAWTAPESGFFRFGVLREPPLHERFIRVGVFQGERLAALERLGDGPWGAGFLAEAGRSYWIRMSAADVGAPLNLRWYKGNRPDNDDFAAAASLTGADGSFEGDNWGATLEPGEWLGNYVASAWHRWTAPSDGVWEFNITDNQLAVFTGQTISNLRLVSGSPLGHRLFPAQSGEQYHIAVVAFNAFVEGRPYTLSWSRYDAGFPEIHNDAFANAEDAGNDDEGAIDISSNTDATVEPGEPSETGARTQWWSWTAPESGRFTWRLTDAGIHGFKLAIFAGPSLDSLRLLGAPARESALQEFSISAQADQRHWIGVGLQERDSDAFSVHAALGRLQWAPSPDNDGLSAAAALGGASGSLASSNRYATTERNEAVRGLGHSSLWWDFDAPSTGAYRFETDGRDQMLAVYRRTGDGFDDLELIETGIGQLTFNALAGTRYAIRVGTLNGGEGGDFTLRWRQDDPGSHTGRSRLVPLFMAAAEKSNERCEDVDRETREGFVRVINRSDQAGEVRITAQDDTGASGRETVILRLEAKQRVHFNSGDLEQGTANKPLTGAIGDGEGDWRLRLDSELDIQVMAYARSHPCGFLTSLHDMAPCAANRCQIAIFNPASNQNQRSLLRLINPGAEAVSVTITGVDDAGQSPGGPVRFDLPAGAARTLGAAQLESEASDGREGLRGALGDGAGKWELTLEADRTIHAMSLMESPTGHLTNLSTAPD